MDVINPHRFPVTAPPAVDFDGFGNASRYFDGVSDYIDLGDSDDFSFGDGTNDSAFSCAAWVKMDDHLKFRIITKYKDQAPDEKEWVFSSDSNGRLMFFLSDNSTSAHLNRRYSDTTTFASYVGQWIHVVGTYDGSGADSGIKLYINGSRVDDISLSSGSYTAMENTTQPCEIGSMTVSSGRDYSQGYIADVRLYNSELTSTDIAAIYGGENITTNLVGHWLKDTPSLLDHAGTNDGTNEGSAFAYDNPSPEVEFGLASRSFDRSLVQYVSVPDSATFPTGAQTHSCWFKPDATATGGQSIIGKWGNGGNLSFLLYYINTDFRAYISGDGSSNVNTGGYSLSPPTGTWHHAAFVFVPNTSLTLYVNGTQVTQATSGIPSSLYDSTAAFRIGKMDRSYNAPFSGHVCDVRMYDTDLSSTDITALYNGTNVETNLVGHWLTNTDDVNDYAGVNDGTNNGSTYSFDNPLGDGGQYGSASREFSGTNQYITVSQNAFPSGDFSISMWVKRHTTDWYDYISIWDHTNNSNKKFVLMNRNFTDRLILYYRDTSSTAYNVGDTGQALSNNEWYHIGVTYEQGVAIKLFLNGTEDASTTTAPALQSSASDIWIGSRPNSTAYELDGNLADVRIFDAAITGTDMYDLSRGDDFRTNLVGQWLTNKDDVEDKAGTNDGTNNGSTYSQDAPL